MGHYDYTKVDDFMEWCRTISDTHDNTQAFELISNRLNECPDRYLNDFISGLNLIQSKKTLDWIEVNVDRIKNVSQNWGHLAASSNLTWKRVVKWLSMGRPLSLVALDGLMFCTTVGERLNQSVWMRELNPRLKDIPNPEVVSKTLLEYLENDRVPRTRNVSELIIESIYTVEK